MPARKPSILAAATAATVAAAALALAGCTGTPSRPTGAPATTTPGSAGQPSPPAGRPSSTPTFGLANDTYVGRLLTTNGRCYSVRTDDQRLAFFYGPVLYLYGPIGLGQSIVAGTVVEFKILPEPAPRSCGPGHTANVAYVRRAFWDET